MRIRWTKLSLQDLQQVWSYIAADKPQAADEMMQRMDKVVASLVDYPDVGRSGRIKGTRELIVVGTPYLIPYRIKKGQIEILAVLHGARRWPQKL